MEAHTNPGTYPGNPSLPREVKDKILSTFRHTLNLFKEGKIDDCLIGCDFILKMDARFAPARQLLEKARNPSADIDVSQLEALVATTPTRQERVVAADPDRLLVRAVESFNARDFDAAISAAEQVLSVLPGNRDALEILEKARAKKKAQPVFDGSRQRALAALEENRQEDARRELDEMRGLDPDHPAVALLERRIGPAPARPAPSPVPAAPASPPPPPDFGGLDLDFSDTAETSSGGFGHSTEQPDIRFDDGRTVSLKIPPETFQAPAPPGAGDPAGLDALSLDSLSLDLPPSVEPVGAPSDARPSLRGPLHDVPPAAPPGSPADMWADTGGGLNLDDPDSSARPEPFSSTPMSGMSEPSALAGLEPEEEESAAGEREIAGLLRQGDDAARRGERQQAIEVWSRIFLIDINNSEAVSRIEKARQEMAEGNRKISDGLKNGREAYERGDLSGARELFLEVLAVDENEPTARFYLDRIQAEMANPGGAVPEGEEADAYAPQADVPGSAGTPAAASAPAAAPRRTVRFPVSRRIIAMVGIFGALVLGLVYFLVLRAPRPKAAAAAPATAAAPGPAPAGGAGSLARAQQLLGAGKIGEARLELRRIPPSSPDHEAAQRMITDLGKSGAPGPGVVAVEGAPPAAAAPPSEADAEPARMRIAAERALKDKRYIEALKTFSQAAPAFKNDPTFAQSMGVAAEKVTALTPAVKLYNEGEYETAIPVLWRIFQEDRDNQDARTYLLRAYYNQGVTQLQNGLYPKAIQSFGEALTIDPADAEAIRHRKFAERYLKSDLDLMGRIYVRHLNHRP